MLKWEVSVKVPSPAGINTRAFSTGYSRCLCAPWFVEVAAEQEAAAHSMDAVAVVHISCCRAASGVLSSLSRLHLCSVAAHEGAVTQLSARSSCSKTLTLLSPGGRNPLLLLRVCHFTDTSEATKLDPKTSQVLSVGAVPSLPAHLGINGSQSLLCAACSDLPRGTWWCRSTPCPSQDTGAALGPLISLSA